MEPSSHHTKVLVAWFCPWAQRAWFVANMCNSLSPAAYDVVNDDNSIVLETDNNGMGSKYHSVNVSPDGVSRYMLKSPILQSHSVPAVMQPHADPSSGDSVSISKWIWEHGPCTDTAVFDASDAARDGANKWGDLLTKPFYGAVMNKENCAASHINVLLNNTVEFSKNIRGPFFYGNIPSLVDIAVLPFIYRLFSVRLLQTYRVDECPEQVLRAFNIDSYGEKEGRDDSEIVAQLKPTVKWLKVCLQTGWFQATLPPDVDENNFFFSQKLNDLYKIYALGIGLKSVPYEAK